MCQDDILSLEPQVRMVIKWLVRKKKLSWAALLTTSTFCKVVRSKSFNKLCNVTYLLLLNSPITCFKHKYLSLSSPFPVSLLVNFELFPQTRAYVFDLASMHFVERICRIRCDNFTKFCQSLREHTSITLAARDEIPHRIKHGFRSSTHPQDIRNSIVAVASSAWPPSGLQIG